MIIPFALVTALIQSGRAIGAAPRQPDAASVPADFYMHTPRLSVTVDGVGKKMILDTGSDRTLLLAAKGAPDREWEATIRLGTLIVRQRVASEYRPRLSTVATEASCDGILGRDFLSSFAVGIDFAAHDCLLWPHGALSRSFAEAWVKDRLTWPGAPAGLKARDVGLALGPGGSYIFGANLDGTATTLAVDSGGQDFTLTKPAEPGLFDKILDTEYGTLNTDMAPTADCLAAAADPAVFGTPWMWFRDLPPLPRKIDAPARFGIVGLDTFNSRRILMDLPAKRLYLEPVDESMATAMFASDVLEAPPMQIVGDDLVLGPFRDGDGFGSFKPGEGCRVTSYEDVPATDIVSALRRKDKSAMALLARAVIVLATRPAHLKFMYKGTEITGTVGGP